MAAPKGNKFAGNRKGIKNKKTAQWEQFAEYCMNGGLEQYQIALEQLQPKDYVIAFNGLLEFFKPKLARTEIKGKIDTIIKVIRE